MLQSMGSQGVGLYRATELDLNLRDSLISLRVEKLPAIQDKGVRSLGQELKFPHAMEQLNACATTTEAWALQLGLRNERSHCNEKPARWRVAPARHS